MSFWKLVSKAWQEAAACLDIVLRLWVSKLLLPSEEADKETRYTYHGEGRYDVDKWVELIRKEQLCLSRSNENARTIHRTLEVKARCRRREKK